jgi:hypothetical protein
LGNRGRIKVKEICQVRVSGLVGRRESRIGLGFSYQVKQERHEDDLEHPLTGAWFNGGHLEVEAMRTAGSGYTRAKIGGQRN